MANTADVRKALDEFRRISADPDNDSNDAVEDAAHDLAHEVDALLTELETLPPASSDPRRATDVALSIGTVKSAEFAVTTGPNRAAMRGVVYDRSTGIEFDVRLEGETWYVNDDEGRDFANTVLETALLAAIEANRD